MAMATLSRCNCHSPVVQERQLARVESAADNGLPILPTQVRLLTRVPQRFSSSVTSALGSVFLSPCNTHVDMTDESKTPIAKDPAEPEPHQSVPKGSLGPQPKLRAFSSNNCEVTPYQRSCFGTLVLICVAQKHMKLRCVTEVC
jgi:hypothetical protein